MQFTAVLALFAAAGAFAAPQGLPDVGGLTGGLTGGLSGGNSSPQPPTTPEEDPSVKTADHGSGDHANVCGNGNKLSCCNSQSGESLINALGSLCSLQVPIIGVPLQSTCGAQQPMCCSTNQDVRRTFFLRLMSRQNLTIRLTGNSQRWPALHSGLLVDDKDASAGALPL